MALKNRLTLEKLRYILQVIILSIIIALPSCIFSQTTSDTIAFPSGTVEGHLPNGFSYYIYPNSTPSERVEFRLVWKVGSLQQDDNEGGGAHFLEHITFGGTKNFPQRSAVEYLESLGMKYGVDINAFTGHDRTIYMFAVPSDKVGDPTFDKPLSILRDWTDAITINPQRVETEKGIILEELRAYSLDDPFYFLKIGQSKHSSRMPLGSSEDIKRMTPAILSDFYKKWYRPSLGAIVVAGDVEPNIIENEIIRKFSSLQNHSHDAPGQYPLCYEPKHQLMIDVDSLRRNEELEIIIPHKATTTSTLSDYIDIITDNILVKALNSRLSQRHRSADIADNWYLSDTNHFSINVKASPGDHVDSTVSMVASEIALILRDGFIPQEIDPIKKKEADKLHDLSNHRQRSDAWCDEFIDHIISGDRHPSDSLQLSVIKQEIMTLTSQQIHDRLAEIVGLSDSIMLFALKTNPNLRQDRNSEKFLSLWQYGLGNPSSPYIFTPTTEEEETIAATPAILSAERPFNEDAIESIVNYDNIKVTEVRLKNGIKLILRPASDKGSVLFSSLIPGGYAAIPAHSFYNLSSTVGYIDMGYIAKGGNNVPDFMYQNGMSLSSMMENDWHGLMGCYNSGLDNEFFNLVYEKITDPELRHSDFDEIRSEQHEDNTKEESILSQMIKRDPMRLMSNRIDSLMGASLTKSNDTYTKEDIASLNLTEMGKYYVETFSQPEDATYFLCGDFNTDSVIRKFAAVFGELPSSGNPSFRGHSELSLPAVNVIEKIPGNDAGMVNFEYIFHGTFTPGLRESLILKLMRLAIQNHLISEIREDKSLVYSPWAGLTYEGFPRRYFYFDLSSSCDRENMQRIHSAVMELIESLKNTPLDAQELDAMKASFLVNKRESLNDEASSEWRSALMGIVKNGESLEDFDRYEDVLSSIKPSDIQDAFNNWINPDSYVLMYVSNTDFTPNDTK